MRRMKSGFGVVWGLRHIIAAMLVALIFLTCASPLQLAATDAVRLEFARDAIVNGLYTFQPSIDVSTFNLGTDELAELFTSIIKDDPYLFFVDDRLPFSYNKEGKVLSVKPVYIMTKTEAEAAWSYCQMMVRELAQGVCGTEEEIALELHDRICREYSYDEQLKNDNIYDFFLSGSGTCQAYTLLYTAVLSFCGIEAHFAASDSISHMWNLVRVDGEWYHVDVTWDDSLSDGKGEIGRRHFLCSDMMASERGHRDWYSSVEAVCLSEKYRDFDFDGMAVDESVGNDKTKADIFVILKKSAVKLERYNDYAGLNMFEFRPLCKKGKDETQT